MTPTEYEQKKRECWEEFCRMNPSHNKSIFVRKVFDFAFDRAYALGKLQASCRQVKEIITQEEIEKAADEFADKEYMTNQYERDALYKGYYHGMKDALGKQEKEADTVIQGWVGRDQDGYISLFKDKPIRDTCDKDDMPYGFWDDVDGNCIDLPITSFPDLTWESDPEPVEIIIKRKKNG